MLPFHVHFFILFFVSNVDHSSSLAWQGSFFTEAIDYFRIFRTVTLLSFDETDSQLFDDLSLVAGKAAADNVAYSFVQGSHLSGQELLDHLNRNYNGIVAVSDSGMKSAGTLKEIDVNDHLVFAQNIWLLPEMDVTELHLRLDSHLYLYTNQSDRLHLEEAYSIKTRGPFYQSLGTWDSQEGLMVPIRDRFQRRGNLRGTVLTNRMLPSCPRFCFKRRPDKRVIEPWGFIAEILNPLADKYNFSMDHYEPKDGHWGKFDKEKKTWNGLVNDVYTRKSDMAAGITIFKELANSIDTSFGILKRDFTLVVSNRLRASTVNVMAYIESFTNGAWMFVGIMVVSFTVGFWVISLSGIDSLHPEEDSESFQLLHAGSVFILHIMQLDYDSIRLRRSASRLTYAWSGLAGFVLFTFFSAGFTSLLTARNSKVGIRSFEDVLPLGFQMITRKNAAQVNLLAASKPGTAFHDIYYKTMHNNPKAYFNSIEEGWARAEAVENKELVFTLVMEERKGFTALKLPGRVSMEHAFALQRDSEFTKYFNYHLDKLREAGVIIKLRKQLFELRDESFEVEEALVLGYDNLFFPFGIAAIGIGSAAAIFVMEHFMFRLKGFTSSMDRGREGRKSTGFAN